MSLIEIKKSQHGREYFGRTDLLVAGSSLKTLVKGVWSMERERLPSVLLLVLASSFPCSISLFTFSKFFFIVVLSPSFLYLFCIPLSHASRSSSLVLYLSFTNSRIHRSQLGHLFPHLISLLHPSPSSSITFTSFFHLPFLILISSSR